MWPVKLFESKPILVSWSRLPIEGGTSPIKWFSARIRVVRWDRFPSEDGISPTKLLPVRSISTRVEIFPSEDGISPTKLLRERPRDTWGEKGFLAKKEFHLTGISIARDTFPGTVISARVPGGWVWCTERGLIFELQKSIPLEMLKRSKSVEYKEKKEEEKRLDRNHHPFFFLFLSFVW